MEPETFVQDGKTWTVYHVREAEQQKVKSEDSVQWTIILFAVFVLVVCIVKALPF